MTSKPTLLEISLLLFLAALLLLAAPRPALAQDEPTIAKDSIQVTAFTYTEYKKNANIWSWVPRIKFRVNGPIASGSQLYVEFTLPGRAPWVKFDCETGETQTGYWWETDCGGRDVPEDKSVTYTGLVSFAIRVRNELAETSATLFTGTAKFGKVRSPESGSKSAGHFDYYVDQDWNLAIGYIFLEPHAGAGWDKPTFHVTLWSRSQATFDPHLFYQGKEVGKIFYQGEESGKSNCAKEEVEHRTRYQTPYQWTRRKCSFSAVFGWDKKKEPTVSGFSGQPHVLSENPGDHEIKMLMNGRLARSIKFTVAEDGSFDNGIATANKLGSDRVIVPVRVIGDQDGVWDRLAWKTEAFYGNPLTGFTAPP